MGKVEFTTKYDLHSFDAAVFCLSIMAEDALGKSLLLCSKLVKAKGAIMVIIPVQKLLGIMPGNKQTETYTRHWEHHFKALFGGFGVSKFEVINNQLRSTCDLKTSALTPPASRRSSSACTRTGIWLPFHHRPLALTSYLCCTYEGV